MPAAGPTHSRTFSPDNDHSRDSDDNGSPHSGSAVEVLTADEERHLESIRDAEELSDQVFIGFRTMFRQTYPTNEALLSALLEAGGGTPFQSKLEALNVINASERFVKDHQICLETNRDLASLDSEAAQAIRDGDLVQFVLVNGQLAEIVTRGSLALSTLFCGSTATNPQAATNCRPREPALPGGYQGQLNQHLRDFLPQFVSMTATLSLPLSLTADELAQVISLVASATQDQFQATGSVVSSLTPPDEMVADNGRLVRFFSELLSIFRQTESLAESGEPEAAQQEVLRLALAFCSAQQGFESRGFKNAVSVLFQGPAGTCRGDPF